MSTSILRHAPPGLALMRTGLLPDRGRRDTRTTLVGR